MRERRSRLISLQFAVNRLTAPDSKHVQSPFPVFEIHLHATLPARDRRHQSAHAVYH